MKRDRNSNSISHITSTSNQAQQKTRALISYHTKWPLKTSINFWQPGTLIAYLSHIWALANNYFCCIEGLISLIKRCENQNNSKFIHYFEPEIVIIKTSYLTIYNQYQSIEKYKILLPSRRSTLKKNHKSCRS